ncbi:MAG TPA: hypothetical protein VGQ09_19680 [Chitinophagaceae bacterium]|jgi:hypothetical protein|nr:hypothetical protein [Chitinophagaceae bacterium]
MFRKKPDVDIIHEVLQAALLAYPSSSFIQSLAFQYQERGGLSKKQLEGLYNKALKIKTMPPKWLATLEAEILKKPTRYKSVPPSPKPLYTKDEILGQKIVSILEKYPQHKRVLFLKSKYDHNEPLSSAEITELEKFNKLLR